MKRVVLDTNVFVSILKKGRLRKILDLWLSDRFILVVSDEIVKEIFEVLSRPKFAFSAGEINELGDLIFEKAIVCNPQNRVQICSDPSDNKFIECAVAGEADYLVSGDAHLQALLKYQEISVISPSDFMAKF
jgi:putative PIN family toxin of toxin-antitoxin system